MRPFKLKHRTARFLLRFRWSARVLCFFALPLFEREIRSYLHARSRYYERHYDGLKNRYLLRRNIHRLEKGLLHRPVKAVFAEAEIGETVECFAALCGNDPAFRDPEILWAKDVLDAYFDAVRDGGAADAARERFRACVAGAGFGERGGRLPYAASSIEKAPVSYDDFFALVRQRKSVRWFLPRAVPREAIERAVAAASQAPSACNRQPYEFRVFDDAALARTVASIPMGTQGFAHNFPAVVVVVGKTDALPEPRDRHLIYVDGALAAMLFMLALEAQGLNSCPINWPDIEDREKAMERALALEAGERPVMLIAVGYADPAGKVAFSQRKSAPELSRYNRDL